MSNKEIVLPDYLKDLVDDSSKNLVSVTSSVPRISLKGKKFRLIVEGDEVEKINDEMHVVILGTVPERGMAKTFYLEDYDPEDSAPPDCSSSDGIHPDDWISNPQNDVCASCKQNAWGSAKSMSGGKAKACRDSKRLMVVKAQDLSGTIYILNITVASLKNLSSYGKELVKHNIPMAAAITTLIMDDDSDFPRLEFKMAGILKQEKGTACLARAAEKEWDTYNTQQLTSDGKDTKQIENKSSGKKDKKKDKKKKKKDKHKDETRHVKGELVDSKDDEVKAHVSDVDDLLGNWE